MLPGCCATHGRTSIPASGKSAPGMTRRAAIGDNPPIPLFHRSCAIDGAGAAPLGVSMQYIYTMIGVGKIVPPKRQIIKDISLSFFPGAKIGLLGLNGAGKSTVLRIMAGIDKEIEGEAIPMPGIKIGYLAQEPQLDPEHTVREAVEEGVGEMYGAQTRLERCTRPTPSRCRFRQARRRAGSGLEAMIAAAGRHRRRAPARDRRRRAAPAAVGREDRQTVGRRKAPRRAVPPAAVQARHAAARRADQPSRRRIGRMAGTVPAALPRHRGRGHPRSLLPRQRRRVDSRTRPRPRHSVEGQLQSWLEQKEARLEQEEGGESARQKAIKRELEWVRRTPRRARPRARRAWRASRN